MFKPQNRDEASLLLYFEDCVVNQGCRVKAECLNRTDMKIAQRWSEAGLITFRRLPARTVMAGTGETHEVLPGKAAIEAMCEERKARLIRQLAAREHQLQTAKS